MSDDALTNLAYQSSVNALATSNAYGILFNAILRSFLNTNVMSHAEATAIFFGAAGIVDAVDSQDQLQQQVRAHMRKVIEKAASGFGIQVPPKGQTGTQITQ
jgi:folate-dependent tRNA-U54 methylase TrmFO/GidA